MNNLWPNDCISSSFGNIYFFNLSSWTTFVKEFSWLEAPFRLWRNECVLWLNERFLICDEMNGSGIKRAAFLGRAQLPGGLPPENICFQVRAGHFQKLQETSGIYFLMVLGVHGVLVLLGVLSVLALSVFDDGNMPAIQLIPRGGLKSPHSYEGWIVVWSR